MFNACWHMEWNGHLRKTKLQGSGDPFRARTGGFSGSLNHLPENLQGPGPQPVCWLRRAQRRLRNLHIYHFPRDSYTRWGLRASYIFSLEHWKVIPGQPPPVWKAFNSSNNKTKYVSPLPFPGIKVLWRAKFRHKTWQRERNIFYASPPRLRQPLPSQFPKEHPEVFLKNKSEILLLPCLDPSGSFPKHWEQDPDTSPGSSKNRGPNVCPPPCCSLIPHHSP